MKKRRPEQIWVSSDIIESSELTDLVGLTGQDQNYCLGALIRLWSWAAVHLRRPDFSVQMSPEDIDMAMSLAAGFMQHAVGAGLADVEDDATKLANTYWRDLAPGYDRRVPKAVRERVFELGGHQCAWCGSPEELQIDHIFPVSRGGTDDEENLQTLCGTCNRRKGASIEWGGGGHA